MKQVLFVCSANYYRSRFAEHLFNWLAERAQLSWRADSRGLLVGHWGDVGPISDYTLDALQACGLDLPREHRDPQPMTSEDFSQFDLVIAVKELEHRPLMAAQFAARADSVEYWHIDDLDCAVPADALPVLEQHVRGLVDRLSRLEAREDCRAASA